MTAKSAVLLALSYLAWLGGHVEAQPARTIWVLQEPDRIVEYEAATFVPKQTVKVPSEVFQAPDRFLINRWGQMLFAPDLSFHSEGVQPAHLPRAIWFWNGEEESFLETPGNRSDVLPESGLEAARSMVRFLLSEERDQVFCFEQEYRTRHEALRNGSRGAEIQLDASYTIYSMNLRRGSRQEITAFSFSTCECPTGACEETCAEAEWWAPEGGIGDFFFVTHLVPGQLSTDYKDTYFFSRSGDNWSQAKLEQPIERMLDAGEGGQRLVAAVPDVACCGWENESNDRTLLFRGTESTVLFDERARYANPDYDLSFFTANARFSPGAHCVAMTVVSSVQTADDIRLSSEGKSDESQLRRIQETIRTLPAVEVLRVEDRIEQLTFITEAFLVDWIGEQRILLAEDGQLVVFDIATETRRESQVEVADLSRVFVR